MRIDLFNLWQKLYHSKPVNIMLTVIFPAGNYMFKVNNRKTRISCETCSKWTIKTPGWRHWRRSGVCIVNFEHISHLVLCFYCYLWTCNCQLAGLLVKSYWSSEAFKIINVGGLKLKYSATVFSGKLLKLS